MRGYLHLWQRGSVAFEPALPMARIGVWHLDVDEERPTGLKVIVQANQRLPIALAVAPESEAPNHGDRPVIAWEIDRMHGLHVEVRFESLP